MKMRSKITLPHVTEEHLSLLQSGEVFRIKAIGPDCMVLGRGAETSGSAVQYVLLNGPHAGHTYTTSDITRKVILIQNPILTGEIK